MAMPSGEKQCRPSAGKDIPGNLFEHRTTADFFPIKSAKRVVAYDDRLRLRAGPRVHVRIIDEDMAALAAYFVFAVKDQFLPWEAAGSFSVPMH